jgi:hypothetical protein
MSIRKTVFYTIAAVLIAAASSANAGIIYANAGLGSADTTLTFDEVVLANGTVLTTEYAAYGVSFSGLYYNSQGPASFGTAIAGNNVGNFPFPGSATINNPWSILFDSDVREASFGIVTFPSNTLVEVLLDGAVIDFLAAGTDADGADFFQITGLVFDQIRVTSSNNDPGALMDNLQFSAVPEPASLALLSLGMLGLIGASRRK